MRLKSLIRRMKIILKIVIKYNHFMILANIIYQHHGRIFLDYEFKLY